MKEQKKEKIKIREDEMAFIRRKAEYWDEHSLDEVWDETVPVKTRINLKQSRCLVSVQPDLAENLAKVAVRQGISPATLVNTWLSEHLAQVTKH